MDIGALFDWDGVVIDSSAAHEESWERLSAEEGLPLFEGHFKLGFGRKNAFIIPNLLKWTDDPAEVKRLSLRKEALYRDIIAEKGLEALPGVRDLLKFLQDQGIPCCVGTSSDRLNIETSFELLGLGEYFVDIVSSEDVSHGKPDPEVFLLAANKVDRRPERCVVFEDALYGIEAGLKGGMKVVAVATTNPIDALHEAHIAVDRLTDLDYGQLLGLFD